MSAVPEKHVTLTVVEHTHISEMNERLKKRLKEAQREGTRSGALRGKVLAGVVAENYESSIEQMKSYVSERSAYAGFQYRASRYVSHCADLIQAIQTKRNFHGLSALPMSKQQEIHEKVLEHFEELKRNLKYIENVEQEHRLADLRSTVWVVKAVSFWMGALFLVALLLDIQAGVLTEVVKGGSHYIEMASTWVVNLIF